MVPSIRGGARTGLFFTEALHPFEVLTQAGFEVDLASETGTYGLDDISKTIPFLSGSDQAILNNPKHPFNVKILPSFRHDARCAAGDACAT
jgi:putative intracellular protease/amidase